ncbi:MAG: N-acetylmuramoyl-L-alanine amidase [Acidobacteria bacterium]|nr:N-acetylmuramoyl-L-alanine amidase [Acidobacteriota bacterium]
MSDVQKLKKEMLRQVVRENRDLVAGRLPVPRTRHVSFRRLARMLAVIVLPVALFVSVNAISGGSGVKQEIVVVDPAKAAPKRAARVPGAAAPGSESELPAPRAIAPSVFRLAIETIVLDAGHGGADPGTHTPAGLKEKEITLDIAMRLRALLEEARFKVVMTRESDTEVTLRKRAEIANAAEGDIFVSIHVNSLPETGARGVETYFLGATDDPRLSHLAQEENQLSGYSLSDFRRLLEGIYVDVRQTESRTLAEALHGGLLSQLRKGQPTLRDRGVRQAPFVVLVATEMPGVLAEVACVSNAEEARLLGDLKYRQRIAEALFTGLSGYALERNQKGENG